MGPSTFIYCLFLLMIFVASLTFTTSSLIRYFMYEYEIIGIFGSISKATLVAAEEIAISANCSAVGLGLMAQSPYTETRSSKHMKNTDDTIDASGFVLIN